MSIRPGNTVCVDRSISSASPGTLADAVGPTDVMRSPVMMMVWSVSTLPATTSTSLPARTATTCGAAGDDVDQLAGADGDDVRRCRRGAVGIRGCGGD